MVERCNACIACRQSVCLSCVVFIVELCRLVRGMDSNEHTVHALLWLGFFCHCVVPAAAWAFGVWVRSILCSDVNHVSRARAW